MPHRRRWGIYFCLNIWYYLYSELLIFDLQIEADRTVSVPGFVSAWGYPLKHADGGILEDGKRERIYYVPYKFENVIMRIESID